MFNAMDDAPDSTWTAAARSAHREAVNAQREAAAYTRITPPSGLGPAHRTYIAGLDAEVKAFDALEKAINNARSMTRTNAAFNTLDRAGGKQLTAWKAAVMAACKRLNVTPPAWVADVGS